jgi:Protease inhibitor/seed storage/LTP family
MMRRFNSIYKIHRSFSQEKLQRLIKTLYKPLQPSTLLTTNLKSAAIPLKLNKPKLQLNPSKQVTH